MLKLLIKLLLIVLVGMGLYIAVAKTAIIRGTLAKQLHIPYKAVAGAHTGGKEGGDLPAQVQKTVQTTVQNTLKSAEEQVMNIKIGDMVKAGGDLKKLGAQLNEQKDALLKQIGQGKK